MTGGNCGYNDLAGEIFYRLVFDRQISSDSTLAGLTITTDSDQPVFGVADFSEAEPYTVVAGDNAYYGMPTTLHVVYDGTIGGIVDMVGATAPAFDWFFDVLYA